MSTATEAATLAILGGPKAVASPDRRIFDWPIITDAHKAAMNDVINRGAMSEWDISIKFEQAWAKYNGVKHALSYPNGTAALQAAMFAVGLGRGDEIIVPAFTYWASNSPAMGLGAIPVFADIDRETLCIDPRSIERRIGPRTRAIMVVHYNAHPADMDAIMALAKRHGLRVIEDVSRAQGSVYRGRMCGSIGDVGALSMMSRKSFAIGEGGMLVTNDDRVHQRAVAFSHYERHGTDLTDPELKRCAGIPLGGIKARLNQIASACGLVEVEQYPVKIAEIDRAMRRFHGLIAGIPGLRLREIESDGSTMGGWYYPVIHYDAAALHGLPVELFGKAVANEGAFWAPLPDQPLHMHPFFHEADIYNDGRPTRLVGATRDVRDRDGDMPVSESIRKHAFMGPWFRHDWPAVIEQHAAAYRKVAAQAEILSANRDRLGK